MFGSVAIKTIIVIAIAKITVIIICSSILLYRNPQLVQQALVVE
jgi:hypothetical protein